MSENLRWHLADVTTTSAIIMYSTLVDADVTVEISAGSVVDSGRTNQHSASYIATGSLTISGLSPWTRYSITVTQGAESYTGTIWTDPSNQTTPCASAFSTCTNWRRRQPTVFKTLRETIEASWSTSNPITKLFQIDDLNYFDGMVISSGINLPDNSEPQTTGAVDDYVVAFAAWHGHEPTFGMFTDEDFQWVLHNVSNLCSGGDHMFEHNHCTGMIGVGDYNSAGCPRDPAHTLPDLEANALAVWNAFVGEGNPQNLAGDARSASLTWGKQFGPVRFALFDRNLNAIPFDGIDTTQPLYGATQLANIRTYLDVDKVPFKCALKETGFSQVGQPWREWFTTEADAWHAQFTLDDNLNSKDGWFFGQVGDNHTMHASSFDGDTGAGFWAFCPGTTGNSSTAIAINQISIPLQIGTKTGRIRYWRMANSGSGAGGGNHFGAFQVLKIMADETPQRLEMHGIESGGNTVYQYQMSAVSGNDNQWTNMRGRKAAI